MNRVVKASVVISLALASAWLALTYLGREGPTPLGSPKQGSAEVRPSDDPAGPLLEPVGPQAVERQQASLISPGAQSVEPSSWVLQVRVVSTTRVDGLQVLTGFGSSRIPVGSTDQDGLFEGDISHVIKDGSTWAKDLMVSISSRGSVLSEKAIPFRNALVKGGTGIIDAQFTLEFESGLSGRVLLSDGFPASDALVVLFASTSGEPPLAQTRCDRNGEFELRGFGTLMHLAVLDGAHRPYVVPINPFSGLQELDVIRLNKGALITGVLWGDGADEHANYLVAAKLLREEDYFGLDDYDLHWIDGQLEYAWASAEVANTDGAFEIAGLAHGTYELRFMGRPEGGCVWSRAQDLRSTVEAPATNVVFDLVGPRYWISFTDDQGAAVSGVMVESAKHGACFSDESGVLLLMPPEEEELTLIVSREGYASRSLTLEALPSDAVRSIKAELYDEQTGSLELRLTDSVVDALYVVARPIDAGALEVKREVWLRGGSFPFPGLQPGRYEVVVLPGPMFEGAPYLPERFEANITPGAIITRELQLVGGGLLEIRVLGPSGQAVPAACSILRLPNLQPIDVEFLVFDPAGGNHRRDPRSPHPSSQTKRFVRVSPSLSPGEYMAVTNLPGYQEQEHRFTIESGSTQRVEIQLREN